jgi:hypothetical protein
MREGDKSGAARLDLMKRGIVIVVYYESRKRELKT